MNKKHLKHPTLQTALSKLPFLATVEKMFTDRNYGFLLREGMSQTDHFRVDKSLTGQSDFTILAKGDKVLCQIGSTFREPTKRSAVLWAPLLDWDWAKYGLPDNQEALDLIRFKVLQELHPAQLDDVVAAKWYRDKWNGTPPQDLSDPILKKAWMERIAPLSPDALEALDLPTRLSDSPFAFTKQFQSPKTKTNFSDVSKLPFLATVETLVADRGFGLLKHKDISKKIFFHVNNLLTGQSELTILAEGDKVLCQIGSTSRKPTRCDAVRWAPLLDFDWSEHGLPDNQEALDLIRFKMLRELHPKKLDSAIAAKWYRRHWQWDGTPPVLPDPVMKEAWLALLCPADLSDPVLKEVWLERLALLCPDALKALDLPTRLSNSPFTFTRELDTNNAACSVSSLLSTFSPIQLAQVCAPRKEWLASSWSEPSEDMDSSTNIPRKLEDAEKIDILQWFLEYHNSTSDESISTVLNGTNKYEATFANHLLAKNDPLPNQLWPWLRSLATNELLQAKELDILVDREPALAASIFTSLTLPAQRALRTSWKNDRTPLDEALAINPTLGRDIILRLTLAVDLETDGEKTWEIGVAHHDNNTRLHDAAQGTDLETALKNLSTQIDKAEIIVGHYILAWDWPILSTMIPDLPNPLIWDTLLVQFLLNPQARSHALGSNHHAETDAKAARSLFVSQLHLLDTTIKTKILSGQLKTCKALIDAIILALPKDLTYARSAPKFLTGAEPDTPTLIRSKDIREVDWVPGVQVIPINADESLDPTYWQIDIEYLHDVLSEDQRSTPNALVLLAMCAQAKQQNIAVRRNMIPGWLCDGLSWLVDAIDQSCFVPTNTEVTRVSPFPKSLHWWADAAITRYRAVLPDKSPLIINRYNLSSEDIFKLGTVTNPALVNIPGCNGSRWALPDLTAKVLDIKGGWRGFDVIHIPETFEIIEQQSNAPDVRPRRPHLAMREFPSLFPGSQSQGDYWISQIAGLRAIHEDGAVPIFLLTSTTSRTMIEILNTACAEIGMTEIKSTHHSRREHLLRASTHDRVIIDGIDRWHDWQSIADDADITLQPVVEALPLEEWYTLSVDINQAPGDATVQTPLKISMVEVLKDIRKLVESRLIPWLVETGVSGSDRLPILLDSRLESAAYDLRTHFNHKPIILQDWSADQRLKLKNVFADFDIKREEAPSDFTSMEHFLVKNWQPRDQSGGNSVKNFKETQTEAIEHISTRTKDVMVTLPTGEGKSVLFQVPALCRGLHNRRLTLVISPLKALMRDQVTRLHEQGFHESADFINSDQSHIEQANVLQGVLDNRIILLYVAPERLRNALFVDVLHRRIESDGGLEYVVFDEAHCINHWGYEFRPDYFFAFSFLMNTLRDGTFPNHTPFLMLSATLTKSDHNSIKEILEHTAQGEAILPCVICPDPANQGSPLHSHIKVLPHTMKGNIFEKESFQNALEERLPHVIKVINQARSNAETTDQRSAVINFVSWRSHADDLADELTRKTQYDVESYHAGLDASTRDDIYDRFRDHDLDFLVATKAFGMGMDIPDIHWVVHLAPPNYLEDYLQEVGRIGRGFVERQNAKLDKLDAVLLASPADFENIRSQQANNEIQEPQINVIENKILENSEILNNQRITIVPDDGYEIYKSPSEKRANATRLRMALYWLETAGHLRQLGMVADILKVTLVQSGLVRVANMNTIQGRVARAILDSTNDEMRSNTLDVNLLRRVSKSVSVQVKNTNGNSADVTHDALINLSRIRHQCHIETLDKTMSIVVELASHGALKLKWELEFSKRPFLEENLTRIDAMMTKVSEEVHKLFKDMNKNGELTFVPDK